MNKATITQVGTVTEDADGKFEISGWGFDCRGEGIEVYSDAKGEPLFLGWPISELREVASRPSEFVL